jgi:glycosyltransferase involved in cell wall biosynthesis
METVTAPSPNVALSARKNGTTQQSKVALLLISSLEFGGAQRQVIELANNMDPEKYEVHVCSFADYVPLADTLRNAGERLHIIRKAHKFDFRVVPKLARLMRKLNVDVLHTFLFDAEFYGRLAGRLARIPAIIGSERNTDYVSLRRHHWAFRLTRSCTSLIIANSRAGADFNSRTFGVPASKFRVVYNGVDTRRFQPADSSGLRRQLGLSSRHRIIGMFGSFKAQKNHPLLLRAAKQVVTAFPDARFLFVGDELYMGMTDSVSCKQQILALVKELGLSNYCLFPGNQSDVENWYPLCDLTVLPSLFEGTPNVALESMACGVPVVATDVSDNSIVIPDGRTGFIVPLHDEEAMAERILRLLTDESLRRRMSEDARNWAVSQFSGPRLAEKTAQIYDEALGTAGVGPG